MSKQTKKIVLVRDPGNRLYREGNVQALSSEYWEYATLCENVYLGQWNEEKEPVKNSKSRVTYKAEEETLKDYDIAHAEDSNELLPLPDDWNRWQDFPGRSIAEKAKKEGLYTEVWQKEKSVVIVFRGTEFNKLNDWKSNFGWLSPFRYMPFYRDQYTVIADQVGQAFVNALHDKGLADVEIISTGHSLGGGLAQQLAYSLPLKTSNENDMSATRVSKVYAFDTSPVTGWTTAGKQKHTNVKHLKIDRIFEHGEILAYFRLMLSYVNPPSASKPKVSEIRFNFVKSWRPVKNHSMRLFACALMQAATRKPAESANAVT